MLSPPFDPILFDLDGTLTDSQAGITRSIQYALAQYGIVAADPAALAHMIGPPLHEGFQEHFGFSVAESHVAVARYREYYADTGIYENLVYEEMPELLAELRQQHTLLVATSKPTVYAERILAHFDLARYFTVVVGAFLDNTRTDKATVIYDALQAAGMTADHAVMVGDRAHDVVGAHANGVASIAVTYGYGTLDELEAAQPDAMVASVAALRRLLTGEDAG